MDELGIANRPHIKIHKIPEINHLRINSGASGITCQKLAEAEIIIDAGVHSIFLPDNNLGEFELGRIN
jgi:D-serine deaminase-like pyridoxal phosphate-dependent protein